MQQSQRLNPAGPITYGFTLPSPRPDSIVSTKAVLNKVVLFDYNGQTQAAFYYGQQSQTYGQLYPLKDGKLRRALDLQYVPSYQREVLGILQTI